MGYAVAAAFAADGHRVLLISGPTSIDGPDGVDFIPVESAAEMYQCVANQIGRMDIAVFAAAVADYRPTAISPGKIKKASESMTIELVKNPDILASARKEFGFAGTLVGFAAETENLITNAREKLVRKECDLIVANDVSQPGIGFDSNRNAVKLVYQDRVEVLPEDEKHHLAQHLFQAILTLRAESVD
jgi:phosphopantothenoylcysteine synthetase/decarboxylase